MNPTAPHRPEVIPCVLVAIVAAATTGCFSDPASSSTGSSSPTDPEASSSEATSAGSTATSSDVASSSDATSTTTSSAETTTSIDTSAGSTGAELPQPRAAWRFDGDLTEDIENADALAVGSVQFISSPTGMAAAPATGAYIDASAVGSLVLASKAAFTMLVRVRLDDLEGNQMLWSLGPAWAEGEGGEPAEHNATAFSVLDGQFHLLTETGEGTNHYLDPAPAPPTAQWSTVVVAIEADFVRVYVDGALVGASEFVPSETSTTLFYIGGLMNPVDASDTDSLHGAIDDARFWDVVLDENQVALASAM